jgi:hypothetical protein
MTRRHLRIALLLTALSLSACGPSAPFEAAVRAYPADVAYGSQTKPTETPAPATTPPLELPPGTPPLVYGAPAPAHPPTFAPVATATPTPPQCPQAAVDAVAELPADQAATVPPAEATYAWHQSGTSQVGGGAPSQFPPKLTHTVGNVSPRDAGSYTFDVTTTSGGLNGLQRVVNSYQVVPTPPTGSNLQGVSTSQAAGLYLTAMVTSDPTSPQSRLTRFAPPLLLLQFPAGDLPSWTTAGTDSGSGDTMTLSAAVTGHHQVDACGKLVDAWEVHATGSLSGPDQQLSLDLTYDVATQYGGIIIREKDSITGTQLSGQSMVAVASRVEATTSVLAQRRAR